MLHGVRVHVKKIDLVLGQQLGCFLARRKPPYEETLIYCAVWTIAFVYFGTITAVEKIDVSKVITKSDAEAGKDTPPHLAQTMFSALPQVEAHRRR